MSETLGHKTSQVQDSALNSLPPPVSNKSILHGNGKKRKKKEKAWKVTRWQKRLSRWQGQNLDSHDKSSEALFHLSFHRVPALSRRNIFKFSGFLDNCIFSLKQTTGDKVTRWGVTGWLGEKVIFCILEIFTWAVSLQIIVSAFTLYFCCWMKHDRDQNSEDEQGNKRRNERRQADKVTRWEVKWWQGAKVTRSISA